MPDSDSEYAGLVAVAACGLMIAALAPVLAHWIHRRRAWLRDPAGLLTPAPRRPIFGTVLVALTAMVGIAAWPASGSIVTPIAVVVTAYACLTVHHCGHAPLGGIVGLFLVGEGFTLMPVCWLWPAPINLVIGFAMAGVYGLWTGRFWRQQLLDGTAWTTTGRLIPVAQFMGCCGAVAAYATAVRVTMLAARDGFGALPLIRTVLAVLMLVWVTALLVRFLATPQRHPSAA